MASEIHQYKSSNRQQVRIKWHAFRDLFLKPHMHGRLAKLWNATMVHGGEMLSAGHSSVLKSFAARQVEHETATPAERQMLQEQVATAQETAQMHGVAIDAPAYSAEEVAAYENIEKARIASEERVAIEVERMKEVERQRAALAESRMRIQADKEVAITSKRLEFSEKARVALHKTNVAKELRLSSDATSLEQFKLEKYRGELEHVKKALNDADVKNRMQRDKMQVLLNRLDKKEGMLAEVDKRLAKKDDMLAKVDKRLAKKDDKIERLETRIDQQDDIIADLRLELQRKRARFI